MFNYKYIFHKYKSVKKLFRINKYLEIEILYKIKLLVYYLAVINSFK